MSWQFSSYLTLLDAVDVRKSYDVYQVLESLRGRGDAMMKLGKKAITNLNATVVILANSLELMASAK